MVQQHGLSWGIFDFARPEDAPPADGYLVHAMADGTTFGNPEAEYEIVQSLLRDGALAVRGKRKNRTITIRLRFSAPTAAAGPALAAAEKALMLQVGLEQPPPLSYTPAATNAVTSFFDVVVAEDPEFDTSAGWDEEEVLREYRYYSLTLTCLPFARGENATVVTAVPLPPPTPTITTIDACTSFTGWAAAFNMLTTTSSGTVSGYVYGQGARVKTGGVAVVTLTRTGAVSMGATPYLRVEASATRDGSPVSPIAPTFSFDGGASVGAVAVTAGSSSSTSYFYVSPPASFTTVAIRDDDNASPGGAVLRFRVHDLSRTDTLPATGTTRQQSRTATVSGSAPTQAAIRLFDATPAALGGEILVHTSRNTGWQPPLRPYRVSSAAVTADTARVSGSRNTLTSAMVFRIPANLLTEGTYSLMALMNVSTSASLGWSARMVSAAGAATVGSSVVISGSVTVPVTTGYQVLNLAAIPLPVLGAEADQMVELTLTGTANMTVDEVWMFGITDGVLTWIRDADSLTWLEIRTPELDAPRPAIFGGTGAKGTNGINVSWKAAGAVAGVSYGSFGTHRFEPGLMQIFTACTTSLVSQSEIEFFARYHSHVEGSAA